MKGSIRKYRYGVSNEWVEEQFKKQNGKCMICKGDLKDFCIDHDHINGRVRGLLCRKCNAGLGQFNDDPKTLLNALKYLIRN